MSATLKYGMKFGRGQLQIESDSLKQFLRLCGIFAKVDQKCGQCGSDNIMPAGDESKQGYKFYFFKCLDCKAELRFGQRNDESKALFLKDWEGWHEPFRGNNGGDSNAGDQQRDHRPPDRRQQQPSMAPAASPPPQVPADDSDEIPFD